MQEPNRKGYVQIYSYVAPPVRRSAKWRASRSLCGEEYEYFTDAQETAVYSQLVAQ